MAEGQSSSRRTRWNPSTEQIALLKAMYSEGMTSPKAHQIKQITSRLRMYGNIENRNVYYWFQNHKARIRRRQKLERVASINQFHQPHSSAGTSLTDGISQVQQQSAVVMPERQVTADDNEPPTLELFPLHPTGIAEYKSEPANSLGLQRSVCNPDENIDEQNNARSGRGHCHNFFYFIPQNPGM